MLYRWFLKETRSAVEVHGIVHGHPHLSDGEWIRTTDLLQIDPAKGPKWLRTESRLYHLGKPMRGTEDYIRRELRMANLAVWHEHVSAAELRGFREYFGQRRKHLDEAERMLLLLVRNNRIDKKRAIELHKLLLVEIAR